MTESNSRPGVVLRFRDGTVVRGRLAGPFDPGDRTVEAVAEDGSRLSVSLDDLKAVFFLKDPKKRRYEMEFGVTEEERIGAPARVVFQDGEIMRGQIEMYSMADGGFFLYPSNRDSNNEKVFVIAGALTSLAIEG